MLEGGHPEQRLVGMAGRKAWRGSTVVFGRAALWGYDLEQTMGAHARLHAHVKGRAMTGTATAGAWLGRGRQRQAEADRGKQRQTEASTGQGKGSTRQQ